MPDGKQYCVYCTNDQKKIVDFNSRAILAKHYRDQHFDKEIKSKFMSLAKCKNVDFPFEIAGGRWQCLKCLHQWSTITPAIKHLAIHSAEAQMEYVHFICGTTAPLHPVINIKVEQKPTPEKGSPLVKDLKEEAEVNMRIIQRLEAEVQKLNYELRKLKGCIGISGDILGPPEGYVSRGQVNAIRAEANETYNENKELKIKLAKLEDKLKHSNGPTRKHQEGDIAECGDCVWEDDEWTNKPLIDKITEYLVDKKEMQIRFIDLEDKCKRLLEHNNQQADLIQKLKPK
jgi:hypothetical protein